MVEPITATEAKRHLRVDSSADDTLIDGYIASARDWVEGETGVRLVEQEVTEAVDRFHGPARIRAWPISADGDVTVSYRDAAGEFQTITTATIANATRPGVLRPAVGTRWPTCAMGISVTFTAGFPDADSIPAALKQAMLVMLTAFYEDREGGEMFERAEKCARSLCRRYRRRSL